MDVNEEKEVEEPQNARVSGDEASKASPSLQEHTLV